MAFYSSFLNIHRSGVLTALGRGVPQESAARESQSRRVLCTPYDHAPCHFMQSHIRKVYACLAVNCHLRFWQNDRGLLRATAIGMPRLLLRTLPLIVIIIMYIYNALINALSAHMIHINLNMIFYTHVEHSPTKTIYIKYIK